MVVERPGSEVPNGDRMFTIVRHWMKSVGWAMFFLIAMLENSYDDYDDDDEKEEEPLDAKGECLCYMCKRPMDREQNV